MTDHSDPEILDAQAISPRLLRYLRRRDEKLKEEIAQKMDLGFQQLEERLVARFGAAPRACDDLAAMRRDIQYLKQGLAGTNRKLDLLAKSVDLRFKSVLGHIGDQARRASTPTRARDEQGRLVDPLLTAVETRRRLLGVNQRSLAVILQVHYRSLSKWLNHRHATSSVETRSMMQQWLDATEADARAALERLKDWE